MLNRIPVWAAAIAAVLTSFAAHAAAGSARVVEMTVERGDLRVTFES